jgi:hypothetical protein
MFLSFNDKVKRMGRGMIGGGSRRKEELVLIPLPIIPMPTPFGATKRAHAGIMAQKAETVQLMVDTFFVMRKPCKH